MSEGKRVIRSTNGEISPEEAKRNTDFNEAIVHSEELDKIFNEWILNGKGDLNIDRNLFNKLQEYFEYQKDMISIKQKIVEQLIDKYKVDMAKIRIYNNKEYQVYVNDKHVADIPLYTYSSESERNIIKLKDFKYIASVSGNKLFSYIYNDIEDIYIDLRLWVLDNDGIISTKFSKIKITFSEKN